MTSDKRYLEDPYCRTTVAEVTASTEGRCTLSQTVFYPGGGGQPCDRGNLVVLSVAIAVTGVHEDEAGRVWHSVGRDLAIGPRVEAVIDWPFRHALMRHHALLHVVNTVAPNHSAV
jgi:misacylated tRNA(Ala) deacylase